MTPRQQAAELFEAERREEQGDDYHWHPDDGHAAPRSRVHYPQVWEPEKVPAGRRQKRILTPIMIEAIERKVRAIRAAGTNGFRMHFVDFCEALGQTRDGSGKQAIKRALVEMKALDVVYFSDDQLWTGGV